MLHGSCHCGRVSWRMKQVPGSSLSCNCTICRRYGALWAYGVLDEDVHVTGETSVYRRSESGDVDFHFCPHCGSMTHYLAAKANADGQYRVATNLRMSEPDLVADIPVTRFDGCDTFKKYPADERKIGDVWF